MRKIEKEMITAINSKANWHNSNTMVTRNSAGYMDIYLHGNHIAQIGERLIVNLDTLRHWPSMTTRSRLRALGANLVSIKGTLHLNGKSIYAD